ncbi:hypothetical protein ACFP81_06370 [Deinococcus lacus]|uniref:Uncharacterized protein n=1 Tax=Deinococcus lacus TaxID=392561 RepID=A0ABW1YDP7_9DEIO
MKKLLMVGALLAGGMAQAQTWQPSSKGSLTATNPPFILLAETWAAAPGGTLLMTSASSIYGTGSAGMTFCEEYSFMGVDSDTIYIDLIGYEVHHDAKDYPSKLVLDDLKKGTPDSIASASACYMEDKENLTRSTLRIPKNSSFNLLGNFESLTYKINISESPLKATPIRIQ